MIKNVVDLFAGCGGMSTGFKKNEYVIKLAVEIDKQIAQTYKHNHKDTEVIVDDINNIKDDILIKFKNKIDVIIGGPPCQGFSMAGSRIRNGFIDDPRNYLFKGYFNVVKKIKPKYFVIENVKGLLTIHNGGILKEIIDIFSDREQLDGDRYYLHYKIFNTENFGIAQKRERLVIVGSLNKDFNFDEIYEKTIFEIKSREKDFFNSVTLKEVISDLPSPTKDGRIEFANKIIYNHIKTNHSKLAIERMKKIKIGENYMNLDEKINSIHSGSYGRMSWNHPSVTITTRFDTPAGGRFIHPIENRTITPREAARIQSFEDEFIFLGTKTSICKQIGNAVPPKLSFFLSEFIKQIDKEEENNE